MRRSQRTGTASGGRTPWWRWLMRGVLLGMVFDAVYLVWAWPDFSSLQDGKIPESAFIRAYREERQEERSLPRLRWQPVTLAELPRYVPRAFVLAEDASFFQHDGVDWEAIKRAADRNLDRQAIAGGGSTISQQTAKNLFLSPSQNPLRKWHELVFTWGLEWHVEKPRILSIYLNVAELGRGVYGVQAGAEHYFGVGAAALSRVQAAELAAALPSPRENNPKTRSAAFMRRRARILGWLERWGDG